MSGSTPWGGATEVREREPGQELEPRVLEAVDRLLAGVKPSPRCMTDVLLRVRELVGQLTVPVQEYVAERLRVAPTQVQGVASFYDRLRPGSQPGSLPAAPVELLGDLPGAPQESLPEKRSPDRGRGAGQQAPLRDATERSAFATLRLLQSTMDRAAALAQVKRSELPSWGGGTPLGFRMELVARAGPQPRQVVCVVHPQGPGAVIDGYLLGKKPYGVLEGLAIAAWLVNARHGLIATSLDLPLAAARLESVCAEAGEQNGPIGSILSSQLRIEIAECVGFPAAGDEVALLRCIEGARGVPAPRPPYPAERGLHGRPTLMVSVESLAALPMILAPSAAGRAVRRKKLFVLEGAVRKPGLAELELGTRLRVLVEDRGAGVSAGARLKGVQIGDRAGGLLPADCVDVALEDRALAALGCSLGAGGVRVLDDRCCVLQLARHALEQCIEASCGKCPPCRIGAKMMLSVLDRICAGAAEQGDLERLGRWGAHMELTSLCRLGQTAATPVLAALRHFDDECRAHESERVCPAGECSFGR